MKGVYTSLYKVTAMALIAIYLKFIDLTVTKAMIGLHCCIGKGDTASFYRQLFGLSAVVSLTKYSLKTAIVWLHIIQNKSKYVDEHGGEGLYSQH